MTVSVDLLTERVRMALKRPFTLKRMFGGQTFMLDGNMLCAVSRRGLMVRVGPAAEEKALKRPFVARCLGAGRPMAGFLLVEPEGVARDDDLHGWLGLALEYVGALPAKKSKTRKAETVDPKVRASRPRRWA